MKVIFIICLTYLLIQILLISDNLSSDQFNRDNLIVQKKLVRFLLNNSFNSFFFFLLNGKIVNIFSCTLNY